MTESDGFYWMLFDRVINFSSIRCLVIRYNSTLKIIHDAQFSCECKAPGKPVISSLFRTKFYRIHGRIKKVFRCTNVTRLTKPLFCVISMMRGKSQCALVRNVRHAFRSTRNEHPSSSACSGIVECNPMKVYYENRHFREISSELMFITYAMFTGNLFMMMCSDCW